MPRKTKEEKKELEIKPTTKPTTKKVSSNSSVKKATTSKNNTSRKISTTISKKTSKKDTKRTSTKSTKTSTSTKSKTAKVTTKKKTTKTKKVENDVLEYYDLPYRYNETIVKILAQTPKKLFVYWDISDDDRNNYINKFGNDFFNNTVPVLIIHNETMNYTFEVEINDFANCWYLDINDTKCKYSIELGRRSKIRSYYIPNNYFYVTSSNKIETPNDHILFGQQSNTVYFRNVKNNTTYSKDIANLTFIKRMGKIYSIYEAYKKLYDKIYSNEDITNFNVSNPSSSNPTSTFK